MALFDETGLRSSSLQSVSSNLMHSPVACSVYPADQWSVDRKAKPPGETNGGSEWRCDACQRLFPGRTSPYHQGPKLQCQTCHTRFQYDFAASSYVGNGDPRLPHGRRGRTRPVESPTGVKRRRLALVSVHQPSTELKATLNGHQTLRNFSKRAENNCSKFCYEKKERGEPCVLRVNQLSTELLWGCNGSAIYHGQENCVEFNASDRTAGIYLCFVKGTDELLLVHIVSMREEESRPLPLGKDQLLIAPNLECLSDAHSDNDPVVCHECTRRDTIFLPPQRVQEFSPVVGDTVTLDAPVCEREINKFRFVWIYNWKELPSQDLLSYTFQALEPSYCVCLALNPASSEKVYSSRLFVVQPKEAQPAVLPLSDSIVRTEVSSSQAHGVNSHSSASQSAASYYSPTSQLCMPRTPGTTPTHPACHPPQFEHDSEPTPRPSESLKAQEFLTKELVQSGAFKHPHFNLWSLARSPTCSDSIRGFIQMVEWNSLYISEQRTLEHVIQLICQETTMDVIGIRRCIVLVYELIRSLQEDERNPHHQSLGTRLMQRAPFPPMLTKWKPGQPQCLPRGESVTFSVKAFNANRYNWLLDGVPVSPDTTYRIQVAPNTCGVYQCSVYNSHGCVWTPPIPISMSDEPTSSSITEASCETTYRVGVTPGPSTSVDVAPVEAEAVAVYGSRDEMVVGNRRRLQFETEQVVPGLRNGDDRRGLVMLPTCRDLATLHQRVPTRRSPFDPPQPRIRSSTFCDEHRPLSSRSHQHE